MIPRTAQRVFEVGREAAQWGAERVGEVREGGADTVRETVEDGIEVVAEHLPSFLRPCAPSPVSASARAALAALAVLVLVGCANDTTGLAEPVSARTTNPSGGSPVVVPLQDRPSTDEAAARLEQLSTELRAAITTLAPTVVWTASSAQRGAGCSDGDSQQDGQTVSLPLYAGSGGIPDELWPRALAAVEQIAAGYEFGPFTVIKNNPGDHYVEAAGPYGAVLQLGSKVDAVLLLRTGCHPT